MFFGGSVSVLSQTLASLYCKETVAMTLISDFVACSLLPVRAATNSIKTCKLFKGLQWLGLMFMN